MRGLSPFVVATFVAAIAYASVAIEENKCVDPLVEINGRRGTCVEYNGICSGIVGNSIYLFDGVSLAELEQNFLKTFEVATINILNNNPTCYAKTNEFTCSVNFMPCDTDPAHDNEAYPIPFCDGACTSMWQECYNAAGARSFKIYWEQVLMKGATPGTSAESSTIQQCGLAASFQNKDFTQITPDPNDMVDLPLDDTWGGRVIEAQPYHPVGFQGQDRSLPEGGEWTYNFADGGSRQVPCRSVNELGASSSVDTSKIQCDVPLAPNFAYDEDSESQKFNGCQLACPYPVYSSQELEVMRWLYVIPAALGALACAFVLGDSVQQIIEATGGDFEQFKERFLGFASKAKGVGAHKAGPSTKKQLRKATLYALGGSCIGILYFVMGPLMSIIFGNSLSCPADDTIISPISASDSLSYKESIGCHLSRGSIFVLQLLFNVILYSIFRMYLVVTGKVRSWSESKLLVLEIATWSYMLTPLLFMAIAYGLDGVRSDLDLIHLDLARANYLCRPRLSVVGEIFLIYAPFVTTGLLTTIVASMVVFSLNRARSKVAKLRTGNAGGGGSGSGSNLGSGKANNATGTKSRSDADVALAQLVRRLAFLGLAVFGVVIIYLVTTGITLDPLSKFAAEFNKLFVCIIVEAPLDCASCDAFKTQADKFRPSVATVGIQTLVLSCIPMLFGVFFAAQAVSRRAKERKKGVAVDSKDDEDLSSRDNTADLYSNEGSSVMIASPGDKEDA